MTATLADLMPVATEPSRIYRAPVRPRLDHEQLLNLDPDATLAQFPREQLLELCGQV